MTRRGGEACTSGNTCIVLTFFVSTIMYQSAFGSFTKFNYVLSVMVAPVIPICIVIDAIIHSYINLCLIASLNRDGNLFIP